MVRVSIFSYILLTMLLLMSCIKEADEVKVPVSLKDMKIVVKGFVGRTQAEIYVGQTLPFYNKNKYTFDEQYIKDARVTISDGRDTVILSYQNYYYDEYAFYSYDYQPPFDFRPGQKLYLNIDLPDVRHVDAVTTVPDEIDVTVSKLDSMYTGLQWIYGYQFFNNSQNTDYVLGHYDNYTYRRITISSSKEDTMDQTSFSISPIMRYTSHNKLFTQKYIYQKYVYKDGREFIYYYDYDFLRFFSFSRNLENYNWGKSFYDRPVSVEPIYSRDSTDFLEEPLFSEPIYYGYYSNINGGLGFFEAYQEKWVDLE